MGHDATCPVAVCVHLLRQAEPSAVKLSFEAHASTGPSITVAPRTSRATSLAVASIYETVDSLRGGVMRRDAMRNTRRGVSRKKRPDP
jgi:hypothetical protein